MKIQINLRIGIPHTNLVYQVLEKPGIVAEICPSGFVHSSYLPSDWLTLVWTHPLSQIGNNTFFSQSCQLGGSLHMLWFAVLFGSKVLPAQNQHFGWFPKYVMVPSVVWLQHVFHSKSTFWIVPSVVWLLSAFCS